MHAALTELFLIAFGLVGLLPLLFFRRGGHFNARWWLTATPFFLCAALLVCAFAGVIAPWVDPASELGQSLALVATPLAAASIGLVGLILASWQERRAVKALRERCPDLPTSVSGVMAVLIALFGVLALIGALLR